MSAYVTAKISAPARRHLENLAYANRSSLSSEMSKLIDKWLFEPQAQQAPAPLMCPCEQAIRNQLEVEYQDKLLKASIAATAALNSVL